MIFKIHQSKAIKFPKGFSFKCAVSVENKWKSDGFKFSVLKQIKYLFIHTKDSSKAYNTYLEKKSK
jgi:hypothetical protein